jgi:hypothetical protein
MADATDLKSVGPKGPCGFESRHRQMHGCLSADVGGAESDPIHFEENGSQTSSKIRGLRIRTDPAIVTIESRDFRKIIGLQREIEYIEILADARRGR